MKKLLVFLCAMFFAFPAMAACTSDQIDVLGDGTQCETAKFTLTTVASTTTFDFSLSAVGTFYVDCGNGGTLKQGSTTLSDMTISRSNTTNTIYTCTWGSGAAQTIKFGGTATDYNTSTSIAAISFYAGSNSTNKSNNVKKIASLSGSLGQILPVANGKIPRFYQTFYNCSNLTAIPSGLFDSINTTATTNTSYMFNSTFYGCSKLTSIPTGLFDSINTTATTNTSKMFNSTFSGCTGLTSIPTGLFDSINTTAATNTSNMFNSTFYGCSKLTSIPTGLFNSIDTSSATNTSQMFCSTFSGCTGLTSIPTGLFDSINTTAATNTSDMFNSTFYGCSKLTSIPTGLFDSINTTAAINTSYMFNRTFSGCTGLTSIPTGLFDSINTTAATNTSNMFSSTFNGCTGLTSIPNGLFDSINTSKSTNTSNMFSSTFYGCSKLTSIPTGLFDSINTSNATNTSRMFNYTFYGCSGLTSMPATLFNSNIGMANGATYTNMFTQMFSGCTNLGGYIPSTTFPSGITTALNASTDVFLNTKLATECPDKTTLYATYTPNSKVACEEISGIDCSSGYYLPANVNECTMCPINNVCSGGTYTFNENTDQGIQSCASGTFAPTGSAVCYPHILHVGDSNVYLKSTKQTTPSLNLRIGGDVFYANMITERTRMSKDSSHYLHIKTADNVHYYVCDDTTCPQ